MLLLGAELGVATTDHSRRGRELASGNVEVLESDNSVFNRELSQLRS
jgi:hypothetical protein